VQGQTHYNKDDGPTQVLGT